SPQLGAELIDLFLHGRERDLPPALQLVVQLAPDPRRVSVTRRRCGVVRGAPLSDRFRPGRCDGLQRGEKLAPLRGRLAPGIESSHPLVRFPIVLRVQPLRGARKLCEELRGRDILRRRQRGSQSLKARVRLAEGDHVLARLECLGQLAAAHLLQPVQVRLDGLVTEQLAPEEAALLDLVLDRLPLLGMPREAAANLLRQLRRILQRLVGELRPGRRALRNHLAIPSSLEISQQDREPDLLAQRLEVSGTLRLARRYPALADEALPRGVREERQFAEALVLLEISENLVDYLELLLERDVGGRHRRVAKDVVLRVRGLLDRLVDHADQLVPLDRLLSALASGGDGSHLPASLAIEDLDRLRCLREQLVERLGR